MYRNHGSYFFFSPVTNKWVPLGKDIAAALAQYGPLIGRNWSGRTFGDVIDRYQTQDLPLKRSAQTRKDQARQLTRLKAFFGSMCLTAAGRRLLKNYLASYTCSAKTDF